VKLQERVLLLEILILEAVSLKSQITAVPSQSQRVVCSSYSWQLRQRFDVGDKNIFHHNITICFGTATEVLSECKKSLNVAGKLKQPN